MFNMSLKVLASLIHFQPPESSRQALRMSLNTFGLHVLFILALLLDLLPRPLPSRAWVPGGDTGAGEWGRDEIRNITGMIQRSAHGRDVGPLCSGAFSYTANSAIGNAMGTGTTDNYNFDASRVVPTGPVTVPPHIWTPLCIYLGVSA